MQRLNGFKNGNWTGVSLVMMGALVVGCGNGRRTPPVNDAKGKETSVLSHPTADNALKDGSSGGKETETSGTDIVRVTPDNASVLFDSLFDFVERSEHAHVRSFGVLVDMGSVSRNKHTLGDWKTGWRGNYRVDGTSVSVMQDAVARVFVWMDEAEAGGGRVVVRARGPGGKAARGNLFLNGEHVGGMSFAEGAFSHSFVTVEDGLRAGRNELMFRFNPPRPTVDGGTGRLLVDYVRIVPEKVDEGQATVSAERLFTTDANGDNPQLFLRAGESLRYYLPLPKDGVLRGKVTNGGGGEQPATVSVSASVHGEQDPVLVSVSAGDNAQRILLPLDTLEGDGMLIAIEATQGTVRISDLQLMVPRRTGRSASGEFRSRNVVVVLIDTLRADKLSMYNSKTRVQTPFLDALARESMTFERLLAQENWTKPSVASLLTGLYPATHNTKTDKNRLPKGITMMSEFFSQHGFATAGFVANGYVSDKFGFKKGWGAWTNYVREGKRNRAQFVADDAVAWLKKRPEDTPFFLYVHTIDPHVPYIPPRRYLSLYDDGPYNGPVKAKDTAHLLARIKRKAVQLSDRDKYRLEALYDGEITYHDDHLVRLYEELKVQGLLEDTLLIVTSDHGEEFFERGSVGHGHSLYEEMIHVPLLVRLPKAAPMDPPVRYSGEVELVDIFPTLCEALAVVCPDTVEGDSLVGPLTGRGATTWPAASYSEFMQGQVAARWGPLKLLHRGLSATLFQLSEDPQETTDVSDARPLSRALMQDLLGIHMGRFVPVDTHSAASKTEKTPKKSPPRHRSEDVVIDDATRKQLEALGYMLD